MAPPAGLSPWLRGASPELGSFRYLRPEIPAPPSAACTSGEEGLRVLHPDSLSLAGRERDFQKLTQGREDTLFSQTPSPVSKAPAWSQPPETQCRGRLTELASSQVPGPRGQGTDGQRGRCRCSDRVCVLAKRAERAAWVLAPPPSPPPCRPHFVPVAVTAGHALPPLRPAASAHQAPASLPLTGKRVPKLQTASQTVGVPRGHRVWGRWHGDPES